MPLSVDDAVSRRDDILARMRRASRWITTAAIAAAVSLGSAFAHALPGQHATARAAVMPAGPAAGETGSAGHLPARHHRPARHHPPARHRTHHHLSPPPQPPTPASTPTPPPTPASTPTPPPVVSGGS